VFEDSSFNEKTVAAVEKQIHFGDGNDASKVDLPPQPQEPKSIV
jgi:hypothetical protein